MSRPPSQSVPVPPPNLWRSEHRDYESWMASAYVLLDLLAEAAGAPDLTDRALLDVGCGTKIARALAEGARPIGRYVGLDASHKVVAWLHEHVHDPRLSFHHLDARNELYNPKGTPLDELQVPALAGQRFDVISLFSVFTHLDPTDYVRMLRFLRPWAAPGAVLLYSLFVDEEPDPEVVRRHLEEALASDDPEVVERTRRAMAASLADPPARFRDVVPDKPLMQARFRRSYALELVEGTGWEVVELHPPRPPHIQHFMVCRPA